MRIKWFLIIPAALACLDQLFKTAVEQKMEKGEERRFICASVLRRVENRGMSMNLLSERPDVVKKFSIAAVILVSVAQMFCVLRKKCFLLKGGLSLMAAGAWSNTFDRIFRGYVVDYIGFKFKNEKISTITYNLADFFIAAGAGLAVVPYLGETITGKAENKDNV